MPDEVIEKLRLVSELPETARAGISYSMFGIGGILLFTVAMMLWKRMRSKSYGSSGINTEVEFEKRTDGVTVHKNGTHKNENLSILTAIFRLVASCCSCFSLCLTLLDSGSA